MVLCQRLLCFVRLRICLGRARTLCMHAELEVNLLHDVTMSQRIIASKPHSYSVKHDPDFCVTTPNSVCPYSACYGLKLPMQDMILCDMHCC